MQCPSRIFPRPTPGMQKNNLVEHAGLLNTQTDLYSSLFGETFSKEDLTRADNWKGFDDALGRSNPRKPWVRRFQSKGSSRCSGSTWTAARKARREPQLLYRFGLLGPPANQRLNLSEWMRKLNENLTCSSKKWRKGTVYTRWTMHSTYSG